MNGKNRALGENEFKLYHQGIIKALKEKAFRSEIQPHIGDVPPEDNDVSVWFDTSDSSEIQEAMVMSVSEEESEDLTFNEEDVSSEDLTFNEEEEELTFNEEVDSENLTFNEEE